MALEGTNGNGLIMPVSPMYGVGGGGGFGNGFGGDGGWWILLLFILLGGNRWGNGFGGGNGGGDDLYPWMNQSNQINSGFRDQMINDNVTSIRDGVYGITNQLCAGFAGVNATVNGAQNAIAQQLYTNQIADMERSFAAQTASTAGMSGLQAQLAQCCCDNRAGLADLRYTVATENCADRAAISDGIRDVITNQTLGVQRILDQLCSDKIDAKNEKIADLERQLTMANLQASQIAQTAQIRAGQVEEVDALYNRLSSCPVPSMPVYGMQPIFTCPGNNNGGCGCGGNNF